MPEGTWDQQTVLNLDVPATPQPKPAENLSAGYLCFRENIRRRSFLLLVTVLLFPVLISVPAPCFAQPGIKSAFQKYLNSNFSGARKEFRQLLSSGNLTRAEQAYSYKMIGICYYMLGNARAARQNFLTAKKIFPGIKIRPNEVLDESVVSYFNNTGTRKKNRKKYKPPPKNTVRYVPPVARKKDQTYIFVKAGLSRGSVLIDGVITGPVNHRLKVKPGFRKFQVMVDNIRSESRIVNIKENQLTVIRETFDPGDRVKTGTIEEQTVDLFQPEKKVVAARSGSAKAKAFRTGPVTRCLPFGVDQFKNNKYLAGTALFAGQIISLGLGIRFHLDADELSKNTKLETEEREQNRQSLPESERQADSDATEEFLSQRNSEVKSLKKQSYLAFGLFTLIWAGGIFEAWYSAPKKQAQKRSVSITPQLMPGCSGAGCLAPVIQFSMRIR